LVSQLSGGNKQKVVFGKWIGCGSEILILDCPTRGVDIGVKKAMYELMTNLKNEGKAIIMISEELSELMGMSDRLIIMKDGAVMKEFSRSRTLSDAEIIQYMI
jgi:ribose transport system ATP-binding protein